jgi:hypothetical protein
MSGIFKVPKGVTTVTVGPILGGSGGSDARGFVVGGGGGGTGMGDLTKIPPHLIVDSTLGGHHISNNIHQNFVDHTITGQTLMVDHKVPASYLLSDTTLDAIKKILISKMVDEMVKAKCIEFTHMESHETDEYIFRSRIHVVPDTQVRIIREIKDARKTT